MSMSKGIRMRELCSGSCSGSICQAGKPMNNSNLDGQLTQQPLNKDEEDEDEIQK